MASTDGQPPKSPVSSTASFFDMSDDEEGDYNKIMHSSSGRGVKLLFSKSKVSLKDDVCRVIAKADKFYNRCTSILHHHRKITFPVS